MKIKKNRWFSLERYICSFNLAEEDNLEPIEPISTLKAIISSMYSFQKLNQFSQINNVLDGTDTHRDGFLWRGKCISSTKLTRPVWSKQSLP
jgi:hypothetical protein